MRLAAIALCLVAVGCASRPTGAERQQPTAPYQKNIEDQTGITRAREKQAACASLPAPAVGMSGSQVLGSCWGKPDHVVESTIAEGKHAVWSYPEGYLHLTNDTVTRIEVSR